MPPTTPKPTMRQLIALTYLSVCNWQAYDKMHVSTRRSVIAHGWVEADLSGIPVLSESGRAVYEEGAARLGKQQVSR